MEMEEMNIETEEKVEEKPKPSGSQQQKTTEEEDDANIYSKLQSPSEDLYTEATRLSVQRKGTSRLQDVRFWRGVSAVLAVICLLLLLFVILLVVLRPSPTRPTPTSRIRPHINFEQASPSQPSGCHQCKNGWVSCGQSCFLLNRTRKNWNDGQKHCQAEGGSLAIITDKTVQDFLTQNGRGLTYWIGLSISGSWKWVDHTHLTDSYWSTPRGFGECAVLSSSANGTNWLRDSCTRPNYFICEIKI